MQGAIYVEREAKLKGAAIGLGLGQVAHALLFDEVAVRVSSLTMRCMLRLRSPSSSATLGARFLENPLARAAAIHAIDHQAMQMDIEMAAEPKRRMSHATRKTRMRRRKRPMALMYR
jgi:hypothetical protein